MMARALPQPFISLSILGLWFALAPRASAGQLLLGAIVALVIPLATQRFWPGHVRLARPGLALLLLLRVVRDIGIANIRVALLVLGPLDRLRPAFLEVPIDIDDPFVATLLGSIVSLTPGTVAIDIDFPRQRLLVHALDVEDEPALIAAIKSLYEAPLKEIFQC